VIYEKDCSVMHNCRDTAIAGISDFQCNNVGLFGYQGLGVQNYSHFI
jgi:hypothetical protein